MRAHARGAFCTRVKPPLPHTTIPTPSHAPEARLHGLAPQQGRVDVVYAGDEVHVAAAGQLRQQRLLALRSQACETMGAAWWQLPLRAVRCRLLQLPAPGPASLEQQRGPAHPWPIGVVHP